MLDLETIGFYLYMEETEARNETAASWESCPPNTGYEEEKVSLPGLYPPTPLRHKGNKG